MAEVVFGKGGGKIEMLMMMMMLLMRRTPQKESQNPGAQEPICQQPQSPHLSSSPHIY
jgi:hypothetical protein